jgi:N-acetylmuramoyl-L-alanine amidase
MMLAGAVLAVAMQIAAATPKVHATQTPQKTVSAASATPKAASRVIIDAGHGGRDPGGPMANFATTKREKDIALQVALKVGDQLRSKDVQVLFTRTKDTLIALDDRGRIANQQRGDVFISIHVNAANPTWKNPEAARGFETYFLAEAKTEDARRVEEMENEAVRFEVEAKVERNDPLSFILSDMMQNEHLRESADLAELVQRHMAKVHPGPSRGVKQAGFRVLVSAFMPAVLVELGFGTNAEEAAFLSSSSKQRELAKAIADATREYLERHQRRMSGGAAGGVGSSGTHD